MEYKIKSIPKQAHFEHSHDREADDDVDSQKTKKRVSGIK